MNLAPTIQPPGKTSAPKTGTPVKKVTRLARFIHGMGQVGDVLGDKLTSLVNKLDPTPHREDYLRRKTRLTDKIARAKTRGSLKGDQATTDEIARIEGEITRIDTRITDEEKLGKKPNYGKARSTLTTLSDEFDKAIAKANERQTGRLEDLANQPVVEGLTQIVKTVGTGFGKASPEDLANWRDRYEALRQEFFSDQPGGDLGDRVTALDEEITTKIDLIKQQMEPLEALLKKQQERLDATTTISVEQRIAIDGNLAKAARELAAFEFGDAKKTIDLAKQALDDAKVEETPTAPTLDDVKQALQRTKTDLAQLSDVTNQPTKDGGTIEVSRLKHPGLVKIVPEINRRLRIVEQALALGEPESALPLSRMLGEIDVEITKANELLAGFSKFENERPQIGQEFKQKIASLRDAIFQYRKNDNRNEKEVVHIADGLIALEDRFDAALPDFLSAAELKDSGLPAELAELTDLFDKLTTSPDDPKTSWEFAERELGALTKRVEGLVEKAKKTNVGLLVSLDLMDSVPQLVTRAEVALKNQSPVDFGWAKAGLENLATDIENGLSKADPQALENLRQDIIKTGKALTEQLGNAQKRLANTKSGVLQSVSSKEHDAMVKYGEALAQDIADAVAIAAVDDLTTLTETKADLDTKLTVRVADFHLMTAKAAGEKVTGTPPDFTQITKLTGFVREMIEKATKDSDLGTRAGDLKDYLERLEKISAGVGTVDPREVIQNLSKLYQELTAYLDKAKQDIKLAKKYSLEPIEWWKQISKAKKAAKKKYADDEDKDPLAYYAEYLAALDRRIEAYQAKIERTLTVPAEAEREALIEEVDNLERRLSTFGVDGKVQADAKEEAAGFKAATDEMEEMIAVRLTLANEKAEKMVDQSAGYALKTVVKRLIEAAKDGRKQLAENRDVKAARKLLAGIESELSQAEQGGRGDLSTLRGDLTSADNRWKNAVKAFREAIQKSGEKIVNECSDETLAGVATAAETLKSKVLDPLATLFDPGSFSAAVKQMATDKDNMAEPREAILREIRRLRGLIRSDARFRVITESPFDVVLPLAEIADSLTNLEKNVVRFV